MEGVWKWARCTQGQTIPCECSVRRRQLGNRQVRVVAVRDIRTRLAAEAEIRQLAHFDALTGLSNRRSLLEQVVQELAAADLQPRRAALATININAFQSINDRSAWPLAIPCTMARRLSALQSQGQRLARWMVTPSPCCCATCRRSEPGIGRSCTHHRTLVGCVAEPLEVQGQVLHLSAGAGVVMIPNDSRDAPELLREAETAMHRARMRATAACTFSPTPCRKPPANAWRCAATCAERWKPSPRRCCCTTSRRWTARATWPV